VGPRNIASLEHAIQAVGGPVAVKIYERVDHVEILLALSRPFGGRATVHADIADFAHRVTAQSIT